jgi:predicted dehydrogenase
MPMRMTRRAALSTAAAFAVPNVWRARAGRPNESVRLAVVGAGGQGEADLRAFAASPNVSVVAIADVDPGRAAKSIQAHPRAKVFTDWRKLVDDVKEFDAVSVSIPDHGHAPVTMRAIRADKAVYTQKPLTHTLYEARQLTKVAAEKKVATQMGVQRHSSAEYKTAVALVRAGAIGPVREVHSWSNKTWGDKVPTPARTDPVPAGFPWDVWLGVAADRPYLGGGYYHPLNWRKRLAFGTGTFGDMGCHMLDPVVDALALAAPKSVRAEAGGTVSDNWGVDHVVRYVFPKTEHTAGELPLTWYDGSKRPAADVTTVLGGKKLPDQGSLFVGAKGSLLLPHVARPTLYPTDQFKDYKVPQVGGADHYLQWVDAIRGVGQPSAPFAYAGPLTEVVLLGCLATRFPTETLVWDATNLKVTNVAAANAFVRTTYRKGWEVDGLS